MSFQIIHVTPKQAKKEILKCRLTAALEKCKARGIDAAHILNAGVEELYLNRREYLINRTSIKRSKEKFRRKATVRVRSEFNDSKLNYGVIHLDSKMLHNITGKKVS